MQTKELPDFFKVQNPHFQIQCDKKKDDYRRLLCEFGSTVWTWKPQRDTAPMDKLMLPNNPAEIQDHVADEELFHK